MIMFTMLFVIYVSIVCWFFIENKHGRKFGNKIYNYFMEKWGLK